MSYHYADVASPISSEESPLPEPPIDDFSPHVATDDDYYYPAHDDLVYAYGAPLPLPVYAPELYKQPVAAPLPLNLSLAMGYSWSPHAKKFQQLYPPIQHLHSPTKYSTQPPVTSDGTQTFEQDIDEPDLVYPQPPSQHYTAAPPPFPPGYPLRQSIPVKQENDVPFPDPFNNRTADLPSNPFGTYRPILDSEPSCPLDLALQYPPSQVSMSLPVLSAPVPRHSAYYASSLVNNCERTCQEQEQQQERHALRVRTQGLQEQRTVRPAEVSPIIGFAGLPEGDDEDAEGEPDVEPLSLHDDSTPSGHSTVGPYDYAGNFIRGSPSGTIGGGGVDAETAPELNGRDLDYDYRPEEDDDEDGDFDPRSHTTSKNTRSLRPRSIAGRNPVRYHPYGPDVPSAAVKCSPRSPLASASDMSPASSGHPAKMRKNTRTLPIPVPVPNLTKKSRGRRVPTVNGTNIGRGQRDAALGARIYLCDVSGCGKCFARGEHLKRHIRSIHTYEKPHKCPYPGCGKEFSRHDNLGQHMKVHKDLPRVMGRIRGDDP